MPLLDPAAWQPRPLSGAEHPVTEPATGDTLGHYHLATTGDLADAARVADAARHTWAARPHAERAAVLRRAGELFTAHAAELRDWIVRETGSIPGKADFELRVAAEECFEAAALASRPLGQVLPSEAPRLSYTRRVPVGVVGVIAPFNVPLVLAIRSVAPALALGNAVLLKPDPRTAVSGGLALAAVFAAAGLPEDVLHVLPGDAAMGQALVADPRVPVLSFTGSTTAGRAVGEAAGRHLTRAHLELGGNSALIVREDADIDAVISTAAWGSFFHQGQVCMTTGRHLVHASLYDEYVARLAAKADSLAVGDPYRERVHLGPVIDQGQLGKIHRLVEASTARGARLAAGGTHEGLFYRPTVLADVDEDTPAYTEEVFGPVAPVRSFADDDEAVKLAAASPYGLALGIVTRDTARGLELAERVPTGIVHINDQTVNDEAVAPFGGLGASGTGARFGGEANLDAFTETRWTTVRADVAGYPF
ncbi:MULTISPECIES: aldehyde dehydrogenase family protein [Streptomyces]|uniref:Aldehyde dehydrogenase family protein n=1 Tax=Streptomyces evansiae TaxID=3075535 RepID=A0ABU2R3L4_9ACTN|nr:MULTISPECIES: aldehyde dehydrogenase family protein [unclassified Streptomyces]MDT0411296.1 aldehyde dehydrogenase family protein [Streptomyces sp. DSM 41979]MYQ55940.1 aldehyde dehydrogenase family protein [Streptomyces sp. SID4926]WEH31127.1 aldehyde dehydrogenase family protein [Streptomyces sp. AM 3-1-1]SCD73308.1 benzaldehyde dehydrogenase (NAD) [Streptomyces sp. DfronAA-171]